MALESFEFGQTEKLTDRLSELVRKYPKGVGIFKEFLQNADDARATTLKVFLDLRAFPTANLPDPRMAALQGPALVFVNDRPFSMEDWKKIQEIGNSGKAMNVAKTGRFGLGFNSVYNVSDYPMILTNDCLGIFDPHFNIVANNSGKPGKGWLLKNLWSDSADLLAPFEEFGLANGQSKFDATIFRLPLRDVESAKRSEIFNEPFELEDFENITSTAEEHASGMVLFLNSVLSFEVSKIHENGELEQVLSLDTKNADEVQLEKEKLLITEKVQNQTQSKGTFEEKLEPVLQFLTNPWKLWENGNIHLRRKILKMAFLERISYDRFEGARTTQISLPFKALGCSSDHEVFLGAAEKTRTSTGVTPQRPQRCASTNSATAAEE